MAGLRPIAALSLKPAEGLNGAPVLQRVGPPTYGFYCEAPGGVLVEVSTMNLEG